MGFINQLNECTDPVAGDYLPIHDASASGSDSTRRVNISRFAVLGNANTFTTGQTFTPAATGATAITIDPILTSTVKALSMTQNGVEFVRIMPPSTGSAVLNLDSWDNGAGSGMALFLGRNSNGTTPAAARIVFVDRGGVSRALWADATGVLRIHTSSPLFGTDTAGTIVGSQSSHASYKKALGSPVDGLEAVANLQAAAKRVKRFVYKDGRFGGQEFSGLVLKGDTLDRYGMDADEEHLCGKILNEINLFGDLILAIDHLAHRLEKLEKA